MKQLSVITLSLCLGFVLSMGVISEAEAKRLGGGKSFGSKPSQSQTAKRTSTANAAPSKAQQQNTNRKQELAKKGGMMGLLGGLMIGGLLGALFFGGAFENINFMDILLFALIAFILFKLFASRARRSPATANGAPLVSESTDQSSQTRQAHTEYGGGDASFRDNEQVENILQTGKIPKGFDSKSFLTGAENVYQLLQEAWDKKELGDLREFCTDNVFAELQDQIKARTGENRTEIVSLSSELVNVLTQENSTEATVLFKVKLHEFDDASMDEPDVTYAQEAWYFLRPNNRQEHVWLLDAIQQVED